MTQESRLALVVDSRQAKPNVEELAKVMRLLEDAGIRATKSNAEVERSMSRMASQADAAASTIKRGLIAAFGGVSTMAIIDVADEWGQYASRIKMATNSTEEYEHVQKRMARSAQTTFRAINETRESFIQMSPVLRDMGLSLDQSIDAVDTFSGLLVVNGANAQRGAAAMEALAKSLQRGRVDAQAWMTIYSTTDTVVDLLAKSMSKSADEVRRLGIEGKLSAKDMAKALVEGNREITAAVEGMPTTVRDAMQNLKTVFTEYIGWKNEASGATAAFAASLGLLGDNLNGVLNVGLVAGGSFLAAYSAKTTLALIETGKLTAAKIAGANAARISAVAARSLAAARVEEAKATLAAATSEKDKLVATALLANAEKNLAAASASATAATRSLGVAAVGLVGGPIGAITLATGLAATAWLAFSDNTDKAKESLIDIGEPLDETVKKFQALDAASRQLAINEVLKKQAEAADEAEDAWKRLYSSTIRGVNQFGSAWSHEQWRDFRMELQRLHDAGESLEPALRKAAEASVVDKSKIDRWYELASILAKANKRGDEHGSLLALLTKRDEELKNAALGAAGGLDSLNAAIGIQKWDEYLKKLTDVRDMIGLNARQLAEFQAAQAGANTVQKAMAGIVGAQADEYKKLQSAIEEKDKKAIEAAQNNIRALDIERQKVELLAIKTSALIAATNAFATGQVSGDVASSVLQSILGGFDQAEAAIAVSKEAEAQIRNIFANAVPRTDGGGAAKNNELKGIIEQLKVQHDTLGMTAEQSERYRIEAAKGTETDRQRALALYDQNLAWNETEKAMQAAIESSRQYMAFQLEMDVFQQRMSLEAASVGMGDRQREIAQQELAIRQEYAQKRLELEQAQQVASTALDQRQYEERLVLFQQFEDQKLAGLKQSVEARAAAETDWVNGMTRAWENFATRALDVAGQTESTFTNMLDTFSSGFGGAFESMVFDAESLGDAVSGMTEGVARSVINSLGEMAAQWLTYQAVQLVVGKTTQTTGAMAMAANATASSIQAGINAFASTAAIPIVGPALAPAAMGAALAVTGPMALAVKTASLAGMAHDGIDSVPQTGTWLLEKGERVTTAKTSARQDSVLDRIEQQLRSSREAGQTQATLPPIINVIEDASKAGKTEVVKNPDGSYSSSVFVRQIFGGGEEAQALEAAYGLKRVGR